MTSNNAANHPKKSTIEKGSKMPPPQKSKDTVNISPQMWNAINDAFTCGRLKLRGKPHF